MKYGYIRVSTGGQDTIRQEYALKSYDLDKVYKENVSGMKKASDRIEFEKLLEVLQKGDTVVFESMSRLARSVQDLISTTDLLVKEKKVSVIFVKENIRLGSKEIDNAMTNLLFHVMGAFAQFERDLISDRTKQALEAKKASGVVLGRPNKHSDEVIEEVTRLRKRGYVLREIAEKVMIPISTVSHILSRA